MTVVPLPPHVRWVHDVRAGGRAVRVSAHPEAGLVLVSLWKAERCTGTVRLAPSEVAELVAGLTHGLAELAADAEPAPEAADAPDRREERTAALEARMAARENR